MYIDIEDFFMLLKYKMTWGSPIIKAIMFAR